MQNTDHHTRGDLFRWLEAHAETWDTNFHSSHEILAKLATEKFTAIGIPSHFNGDGKTTADAISAISQLAYSSLTAAFVLWAHRAYIECLLQSPNSALQEQQLPLLVSGKKAGSAGLSNLMKHLADLEEMENFAQKFHGGYKLSGKMPWITNINGNAYYAACAAQCDDGNVYAFSLENNDKGITIENLDLIGLRSSDTKIVKMNNVVLSKERILHDNIGEWLKTLRPAFISLQCGMFLGLAWRCIDEAKRHFDRRRSPLAQQLDDVAEEIQKLESTLIQQSRIGAFNQNPQAIFKIRIALTECVWKAILLELKIRGGTAYLENSCEGFPRRLREASFVPIITPSVTHLQKILCQ